MSSQPINAPRPGLYARLSVPGTAATHHERWVSVDALRALAALMVLVSHVPRIMPGEPVDVASNLAPRLGVGVWIFFAASGYLIAGPFLRALIEGRAAPPAAPYAIRRAVRILPAYWVAFAAILLLVSGRTLDHWWQVPVHALLLHGFVPGELELLYVVAWSLAIEATFYALVPLAALAVSRLARGRSVPVARLATGVLVLWAAAVAFTLVLAVAFPFRSGQPLPGGVQILTLVGALANFCPGMLVFLAVTAGSRGGDSAWSRCYTAVASRPLPTLIVAGAMLLAATQLPFQTNHVADALQAPLMGVASGLVLATFVHGGRWSSRLGRVLGPVGLVSYGVYLWHWVIVASLAQYGIDVLGGAGVAGTAGRTVFLLVVTLPIATASWLLIERPLLRRTAGWEQKRSAKKPREAGARAVPAAERA